jgi:hypothetical protein
MRPGLQIREWHFATIEWLISAIGAAGMAAPVFLAEANQ